jgi:asparagine synthase (glutamine-hydrolysing)
MCGIWAAFGAVENNAAKYVKCLEALKGRGPEGARLHPIGSKGFMGFTRLAINGLNEVGMQPMVRNANVWMANGEIYNWKKLVNTYGLACESGSDCEVIGLLYEKLFSDADHAACGELFRLFDGVFACVLVDVCRGRIIVARDPYGVRPLYVGRTRDTVYFGSELKSLLDTCSVVSAFEPGSFQVYDLDTTELLLYEKYHTVSTLTLPGLEDVNVASVAVRSALESAVKKRMMTERPVAALLSGGLDSSLVASLVARNLREAGLPPLKTFSIGMKGSSDLRYARAVAEWIGSEHTEVVVTAEEMFGAIRDVIWDIGSYDTTTVRASVGNWLVSRAVRAGCDCKVVFNGDGSDEVWGSYLYMFLAPSEREYGNEVVRLLDEIHTYDVLRSDRCISSHGLEPRTPFLDKAFVQTVLSVPLELRRPVIGRLPEKWLLRRAFDDGVTLPRAVLWRQKEAFSDGVSPTEESWFQIIQRMVGGLVSEEDVAGAAKKYPVNTPTTAEMYYYREIFEGFYGGFGMEKVSVPAFWMPRWSDTKDPSARTLGKLLEELT